MREFSSFLLIIANIKFFVKHPTVRSILDQQLPHLKKDIDDHRAQTSAASCR